MNAVIPYATKRHYSTFLQLGLRRQEKEKRSANSRQSREDILAAYNRSTHQLTDIGFVDYDLGGSAIHLPSSAKADEILAVMAGQNGGTFKI